MSPDIDDLVPRLRAAGCVFAEDEAALLVEAATSSSELDALVAQRVSGTPLEHLLGWAEFRGLRVAVAPGVFVPRQRTGFLVEQAVSLVALDSVVPGRLSGVTGQSRTENPSATRQDRTDNPSATRQDRADNPSATGQDRTGNSSTARRNRAESNDVDNVAAGRGTATNTSGRVAERHTGAPRLDGSATGCGDGPDTLHRAYVVVDMCCGCGALGLATATELSARGIPVELVASDVDPAAVACARRNLAPLGASVYQGDLFAPLPSNLAGHVDILLANVPYVPTDGIAEMPPEARDYEPHTALDGGPDGLDIFRRVAAAAPHWLAPGGRLLVESSREQLPAATEILTHQRLTPTIAESDELYATIVIGTRSPDGP